MKKVITETDRLRLRELTMEDVSNLQFIFSDPVAMRYYPSTKNEEETEGWIKWNLDGYQNNKHGLWAVELKDSGQFIGQCGLVAQNIRNKNEIELGYLFVRKYWGLGYATEAAKACRDLAFEEFDYPAVVSYISPENELSQKVATRTGLELEVILNSEENDWKKEVWIYSQKEKNSS